MPLSFLVPAFLAGLAAIAVAVLVHLTRRQKDRVVPFPSLMFLDKVPYRAESRRRIHHWFLLLLRAAALALLALAFARPFLDDDATTGIAGPGPTERVVVLDRSYSMAVGDHWDRAREAAMAAVSDVGPLDRVSLVLFDQSATAAVRSSGDPSQIRQVLDTASVSDRATRYGPALKLAQTILEESELTGRDLVLVSDLQRAGWTGEEGVSLPPGTEVRTVAVGEAGPANTAIADVSLSRELFEGRERVTPTARVTRIGGDAELEVEVVLEIDGREAERRTATLPPAGAVPVTFQPLTLSERHTRGTVRVDEDALPHDNAYHFVASPGRATGVLILDPPGRGSEPSLYLAGALRISTDQGFQVGVSAGSVPEASVLAAQRVVILNGRPFPSGAEGTRLRQFVEAGGGLMLVAGERGGWPADASDMFPGSLGAVEDRDEAAGGRLGQIDYDHPVFEVFRGPRRGDFSTARFYRVRRLQLPAGVGVGGAGRAARGGAGGSGEVGGGGAAAGADGAATAAGAADSIFLAARFGDGSPALVERRFGEGRVLVWTSTLDAFWTDLALQPVFLPFVHQLVRHASGRMDVLDAFVAGQVLDVTDARAMETAGLGEVTEALEASEERVVLTPSGTDRPLPITGDGHYLELAEQGFYEIRPPGRSDLRPVAVAVNVDPAEADLTPLDAAEVEAALLPGAGDDAVAAGADGTGAAGAAALRREDREKRQSLWRWLLVGAFGLLALETILSNRLSPRTGRSRTHARAT
jgi:hypothetical protein